MHVVVIQHFTVLKSFWVPFTGFSCGEKYFFFNSFESVFFPFVLSYSLIKFLPGACFKQRNERKQKQKTRNKIKGMWFMMIAKWTSSGGRGGWGEKREFSFWPFRDLTNYDGDGKENVKQAIGLISKTTTLHVHHAFLYISLLSLHKTPQGHTRSPDPALGELFRRLLNERIERVQIKNDYTSFIKLS